MSATVTALRVKPAPGVPMQVRTAVNAVAGHGLDGDRHATPIGPRQVLLVRDEDLQDLGTRVEALRANVAVTGLDPLELCSGTEVALGHGGVRIRVTHACELCHLLRDQVPAATMRRMPGRRGLLAVILTGGTVAVGDPVTVGGRRWPQVPDAIGERAVWVIGRIPRGRTLTHQDLLALVGGRPAHARALPGYVRRAIDAGLPGHRSRSGCGRLDLSRAPRGDAGGDLPSSGTLRAGSRRGDHCVPGVRTAERRRDDARRPGRA